MIKYLKLGLVLTFSSLYYLWFVNRGFSLYDEGYIFEASYLLSKGWILYKDVIFQYPPLTPWLGAIWIKTLGIGIIKLRLIALLVSLIIATLGFLIGNAIGGLGVGILLWISFLAWGFPHINFLWPSWLGTCFGLLSFYLFVIYFTRKKNTFFWIGLCVGLSLLSRQNFGLATLVATLLTMIYAKSQIKRNHLKLFIIGVVTSILPVVLILIYQGAFQNSIEQLWDISTKVVFLGIIFSEHPTLNLNYSVVEILKSVVKFFIYFIPPSLFLVGGYYWFTKKRINKILTTSFIFFVIHFTLIILPTINLGHLIYALHFLFLYLVSLFASSKNQLKDISFVVIVFYVFLGFYKTWSMPYYNFETPYLKMDRKVSLFEENLIVDEKHETLIEEAKKFKGERFFVHPFASSLYFIADVDPPTPYLHTLPGFLDEQEQQLVINELSDINIVLVEEWRVKESGDLISNYLNEEYEKEGQIWDIVIRKKK